MSTDFKASAISRSAHHNLYYVPGDNAQILVGLRPPLALSLAKRAALSKWIGLWNTPATVQSASPATQSSPSDL